MASRYYWFKVKEDFFENDSILWVESQPNGAEAMQLYLHLCCKTLKNDGKLGRNIGEKFLPHTPASIAMLTRLPEKTVTKALSLLEEAQLLVKGNDGIYTLPLLLGSIGSECDSAARVRAYRQNNAERQRNFRAKNDCVENHVPLIENDINSKRYGNNYYLVVKRDKYSCVLCGSKENICVHHIDGYNENQPQNNSAEKLITLCRTCHRRVHEKTLQIPDVTLHNIGYNVTCNVTCNSDNVTSSVTNNVTLYGRDRDRYIDIDKEKEYKEKESVTNNVFSIWNNNMFPRLDDIVKGELLDLIAEYGEPKVIYAIRQASQYGKKSYAYVRSICVGKKGKVPFGDLEYEVRNANEK